MAEGSKKKAFDSTICFYFFGKWLNTLECLEKESDKQSVSYTLFKAVANYSMYGTEPSFSFTNEQDNITCRAIWEMLVDEVDTSIENRKRWFDKSGPNKKQEAIIAECIRRPDASLKEIADVTGVSRSSVDRTKKRYAKMIMDGIESAKNNSEERKEEPLHVLRETQYVQVADEYDENDLPF